MKDSGLRSRKTLKTALSTIKKYAAGGPAVFQCKNEVLLRDMPLSMMWDYFGLCRMRSLCSMKRCFCDIIKTSMKPNS